MRIKQPAIRSCCMFTTSSCAKCRSASGATEEFTAIDDAQSCLGAGTADCSRCLDWFPLLQMKGGGLFMLADTRTVPIN